MSSNTQPIIDVALVHHLVASQFPRWADLYVRPVARCGWDNRTFHLGEQMVVRLPSGQAYASQVEREQRWLPVLAPKLPLSIPEPVAMGEPDKVFPWKWSIYRWIAGEPADPANIVSLPAFAMNLAQFLLALQRIDSTGGPQPGSDNFYRGGSLLAYDRETREAIHALGEQIDGETATQVWQAGIEALWTAPSVWVHGDVSAGNLLITEGRLSAVIDFGQLAVGDPACDLAITWTMFDAKNREAFRKMLHLDAGTWARGRAWALWKSLIIAAKIADTNAIEGKQCWSTIEKVLAEHRQGEA